MKRRKRSLNGGKEGLEYRLVKLGLLEREERERQLKQLLMGRSIFFPWFVGVLDVSNSSSISSFHIYSLSLDCGIQRSVRKGLVRRADLFGEKENGRESEGKMKGKISEI